MKLKVITEAAACGLIGSGEGMTRRTGLLDSANVGDKVYELVDLLDQLVNELRKLDACRARIVAEYKLGADARVSANHPAVLAFAKLSETEVEIDVVPLFTRDQIKSMSPSADQLRSLRALGLEIIEAKP